MLDLWSVVSGTSLGIIEERITASIPLPVNATYQSSLALISGTLPPGLRITDYELTGTPFEVTRTTVFTFVLRATFEGQIQDRALKLTVEGADEPVWLTAEDLLAIGPNDTFFILDSSPVDFQLEATDTDLIAGQELEFYIKPGNGELPPGTQLTTDGRIVGVVDPILALDKAASTGKFDTNGFGTYPFDFAPLPANGFSSFFYDSSFFDLSIPTRSPRKLNRYYEFIVSVTDGESVIDRKFRIYVVGDDFLRSDNTIMQSANGIFGADTTYVRTPIWLTPANLGFRRANNYLTIFLDVLDTSNLLGKLIYVLEDFNDDGTVSTLPPGLVLDQNTGELAGRVPYQPAVTKEYKFTVNATRYTAELDVISIVGTFYEDALMGTNSFKVFKLEQNSGGIFNALDDGVNDLDELLGRKIKLGNFEYKAVSTDATDPDYDVIFLETTLNPEFPIVLNKQAAPGDTLLYVDSLDAAKRKKLEGSSLNFNDNEQHAIESVVPYIEWEIISTSGGTIDIDFASLGLAQPAPGETKEQQIQRVFANSLGPTYVIKTEDSFIRFTTPRTANSNANTVNKVFVSQDSTPGDIKLTLISDSTDIIVLDNPLGRTITSGTTTGVALFKNGSFSRNITTSNEDEVTRPSKAKTFTVNILGEVDSTINWLTDSNIGIISANFTSTFGVRAETSIPKTKLVYTLVDGKLPPGLSLLYDGEIVGKVRQFGDGDITGLTIFDQGELIIDKNETTIDRTYTFTVDARDRFGYSAIQRTFTIDVIDPNDLLYSNIYMKPYLKEDIRTEFRNFISDSRVFEPSLIYRPNDSEFGLQRDLKILAYSGIETKAIEEFARATVKFHKKRRYNVGAIKKAVAKEPGTNNIVYEVVYLEIIDTKKPTNSRLTNKTVVIDSSNKITVDSKKFIDNDDTSTYSYRPTYPNPIRVDSNAITANNGNNGVQYISNIDNMREEISKIGITEGDFLPLWMRTAQEMTASELGFITAIPLCYCKQNGADQIIANIAETNFNFQNLSIEIDRYIIDSTAGSSQEQYILFANYQFNV
jgi:hypothetical protein